MSMLTLFRERIRDFLTICEEGPEVLKPHPVLDALVPGVQVLLLGLSVGASVVLVVFARLRAAFRKR